MALRTAIYNLKILDIGLPDGSGLDVFKKLRQEENNMQVLILTAYDETSQRVKILDTDTDDYLMKVLIQFEQYLNVQLHN